MKEKEIKTEKVEKKKVYRRPKRTDKDIKVIDPNDEINEMFMRSGEVIQNVIKKPKQIANIITAFFQKIWHVNQNA